MIAWKKLGINRLSIGLQSFQETDLAWMNRSHSTQQGEEAVRLAQALANLKKAIDAGYNDYGHVQLDTDLDNIRNEKEFLELNKKLKSTGDYLSILKRAGKYNLSDNRPVPAFSYQASDNPNLI